MSSRTALRLVRRFKKQIRQLPFRAKLTCAVILVSAVLMGVTLFAIQRAAESATRQKIEADFQRALVALDKLAQDRMGASQEAVGAALTDPLFRSQAARTRQDDRDLGLGRDPKPTRGEIVRETHQVFASADLPFFSRYPVLAVLNDSGTLLFTKARPAVHSEDLSGLALVSRTLANGVGVELWAPGDGRAAKSLLPPTSIAGDLYLVSGHVILSGRQAVGLVLTGDSITRTLVTELEGSFASRVALLSPEGGLAATPGFHEEIDGDRGRWGIEGPMEGPPRKYTVPSGGRQGAYLALSAPFLAPAGKEAIGRIFLFRSLDSELAPFKRRLYPALVALFALSLLMSYLLASGVSRRMTAPLLALENGMRRLQGGDLSVSIAITSYDEVGFLTKAFNRMARGLREKAVLERLNAKLKSELRAAREIQRSLLPPVHQVFGALELEALYHPCEELSGDFYDSVAHGNWLYLYVADVTSHGTAAAQVTYLLKELFHAAILASEPPAVPELLARVASKYGAYRFGYDASVQVARVDLAGTTMEYARAGSPAMIMVRADGTREVANVQPGDMLSSSADPAQLEFPVARIEISPGDQFYLFTDGAYEFDVAEGSFGRNRLYNLFAEAARSEGRAWKDLVFQALVEQNRAELFADDLTIIRLLIHGRQREEA